MSTTPVISIVIPAYNEAALLATTLAAVAAACEAVGLPYEVIVSDNESTDDTVAIATAAGALVVHESHKQIAANRNNGARSATGKWLVFVDADTLIDHKLLAEAVAALEGGCVGGGALPDFDCELRGVGKWLLHLWQCCSRTFRWACGAFVFCRRDAFEAVGGFDERYYCSEEIHLSRALRKWGRTRNLPFVILNNRLTTSGRKLQWFGPWKTLTTCFRLLWPGNMRRRDACDFWYKRPP